MQNSRFCHIYVLFSGLLITQFLGRNSALFPMPKSMFFFPIPDKTFPIFYFIFWFSIFISYNTNTEHIVTYLQFHTIIEYNHTCFFLFLNYWNQSSNGNIIHKDDVKFSNFSQNAANFLNSMGPGPIPKKWCESPGLIWPSLHNITKYVND